MVKSVTTGIYYPECLWLNLLQLVYIIQRVFVVKAVTTGIYYPESVCG